MPSRLLPGTVALALAALAAAGVHGDARVTRTWSGRTCGSPSFTRPTSTRGCSRTRSCPNRFDRGLRPGAGERPVRRRRAHGHHHQARARRGRALALARLRRLLPGRAGVQPVQGRGRAARAQPHGAGRRGGRQPRVRSRLAQPVRADRQLGPVPAAGRQLPVRGSDRTRASARCATSSSRTSSTTWTGSRSASSAWATGRR